MEFEVRTTAPSLVFDELRGLKSDGYNVLVDLTAVDYSLYGKCRGRMGWEENFPAGAPPAKPHRFEVVYRLAAMDPAAGLEKLPRLEVRVPYDDGAVLLSVMAIWPNADWLEREVWDMFGIRFEDRPDIKRLLLYEGFQGHPLRKDYPIKKRQPLIGPPSGELPNSPSFNIVRQEVPFE
jgi:NADH-quinone oxidoreductase subunit C